MLGRLIDQLFPHHNEEPDDAKHISHFKKFHKIDTFPHSYVWGDTVPIFNNADLRIINLETSVTSHNQKWPNKAFNYRMNPVNLECLQVVNIDFCSLANNHTLDYSYQGMYDTIKALDERSIKWAGVGNNLSEAQRPAILTFAGGIKIACFSYADHYKYWAAKDNSPGINFVDPEHVTEEFFVNLGKKIEVLKNNENVRLVSVSIHWGGNYNWEPSSEFTDFAHRLVDCGVDLIHGHSSHHVQGIEIYKQKIIIYGCGDFVDDYAVDDHYRNDLSFLYCLDLDTTNNQWARLELIPTRIKHFQVNFASGEDKQWLRETMTKLSTKFKTKFQIDPTTQNLYLEMI
jgi:poly-gamma-glutamate capsule biosynthesis protein CapA/YwtB (metallophosphatase superfamily)